MRPRLDGRSGRRRVVAVRPGRTVTLDTRTLVCTSDTRSRGRDGGEGSTALCGDGARSRWTPGARLPRRVGIGCLGGECGGVDSEYRREAPGRLAIGGDAVGEIALHRRVADFGPPGDLRRRQPGGPDRILESGRRDAQPGTGHARYCRFCRAWW